MTTVDGMQQRANHYLYPLNPKSDYKLERGGRYVSTSRSDFFKNLDYTKLEELGLTSNFSQVRDGDYVWIHFALPDSKLCAVGRVVGTPRWNSKWSRFAIRIRWDKELTERLNADPIPLSVYKQVPYRALLRANNKTSIILNRWLGGRMTKDKQANITKVRFRSSQVDQRLGQPQFRMELMRAYGGLCAVTGCAVEEVLQAAHIRPVHSKGSHSCANGLLLRADIHNLFDRGLITIDKQYRVELDATLRSAIEYKALHRRRLKVIPRKLEDRPSKVLLEEHRKLSIG